TSGSNHDKNFFVAKMDPDGTFLWASSGGAFIDDRMLGMHVDPDGNVYCTGTFWGSAGADFGPSIFLSGGGYDQSFLAKMDANGNWLWAREFGSPSSGTYSLPAPVFTVWIGDDHGYDLETDASGNIYITGWWSGDDAYFDSFTLSNPTWGPDTTTMAYVAKLDPFGNFLWARKFDGVDDKRGERDNRMALDNDANIYITGGFRNSGIYGQDTLVSRGDWDIFVTKLDSGGNFMWSRRAGSDKGDRGNGIAIAPDGDIYIDGEFRGDADFGTDTIGHKKRKDIFVAKLKPDGEWKWVKRAKGSAGKDRANQMTVDNNEYVFICGEIGDTIKFGDTTINNLYDDQNPFVAQMSKSGEWLWAKVGGSPSPNERANNIAVDHLGNSYIVGYFEGTADFDGFNVTSQGKKDIFIWKIDKYIDPDLPTVEEPIPPGEPGLHVPMAFSPNGDGNNDMLFVYGGGIVSLEFDIYERWGRMVFHSSDILQGWDGNFNGQKASSGVYMYKVRAVYYSGESETKVGNITLVR
ncbi:MAG: gliding motility-associated C-terminal domain-containing protein, partial [Flavobacteriales bacterium]|nr:gliding motility-associated C-terminal domain-containing protein [Flavobacteriales bacterium]